MAKREPISKSTRFEVFKRDEFTCQYCGRTSPAVILEVDHIVPVSKGGTNDLMNLITSCRDCNRGKGAKSLSDKSAIEKQKQQLKAAAEIKEQTEMMIQWRKELSEVENTQVEYIIGILDDAGKQVGVSVNGHGEEVIRKLLHQFGFPEVCTALDISLDKYFDKNDNMSLDTTIKKMGGICYNRKFVFNKGKSK